MKIKYLYRTTSPKNEHNNKLSLELTKSERTFFLIVIFNVRKVSINDFKEGTLNVRTFLFQTTKNGFIFQNLDSNFR